MRLVSEFYDTFQKQLESNETLYRSDQNVHELMIGRLLGTIQKLLEL